MRIFALAILLIGAAAETAPAHAQTYGRNFPICLQSCALGGCKIECDYTSLAQCNASASDRAAKCDLKWIASLGARCTCFGSACAKGREKTVIARRSAEHDPEGVAFE
jgi:hypothetical protein